DEQVTYWQERIAAGLKLEPKEPPAEAVETAATDGDAQDEPEAAPRIRLKAIPLAKNGEDGEDHVLDADATLYASEDTVEETERALDFLATLSGQDDAGEPPPPPKSKGPKPQVPPKPKNKPADDPADDPPPEEPKRPKKSSGTKPKAKPAPPPADDEDKP